MKSLPVLTLFALTPGHAFVPSHSSTATIPATGGRSIHPVTMHPSRQPLAVTSTSLAMGGGNLVDRFVRVINANINKFVSGLEDPEKVILQANSWTNHLQRHHFALFCRLFKNVLRVI